MDRVDSGGSGGMLSEFGVPSDAEALWRLLVAGPTADNADLARRLKSSEADVAAAAAVLVDAQLVRLGDTPSGLVAIDPSLAVEAHILKAERQLAERSEALAMVRAQIPDVAVDYARGRADSGHHPGFEVIVPLADIRRQIYLAAENEREEVRSMTGSATAASMVHSRDADLRSLARGVRARDLIGARLLDDPEINAAYEERTRYGLQLRTMAEPPFQVLIFDRDLAVLRVDPQDTTLGAIFVRVPSLIEALIYTFDHLWSEATAMFVAAIDHGVPAGRRARILELLSAGSTDERIARGLGLGVRTVRREVADLKSSLGVRSRAEISTAAVRKGWL
jgi:DNA-binding CsgD family transcriptional regulator